MKFNMTKRHFVLLKEVLSIMQPFYENDLMPVFNNIGVSYEVNVCDIEKANSIVAAHHATGKVEAMATFIKDMLPKIQDAETIDKKNPNPQQEERYVRLLTVNNSERACLSHIMGLYSRLLSGQFNYIFMELDIPDELPLTAHRQKELENLRHFGLDCVNARALLVPPCKDFDWNSYLSITSSELPNKAKVAYEMSRVFARPDDFTGFVSGHSMIIGED